MTSEWRFRLSSQMYTQLSVLNQWRQTRPKRAQIGPTDTAYGRKTDCCHCPTPHKPQISKHALGPRGWAREGERGKWPLLPGDHGRWEVRRGMAVPGQSAAHSLHQDHVFHHDRRGSSPQHTCGPGLSALHSAPARLDADPVRVRRADPYLGPSRDLRRME